MLKQCSFVVLFCLCGLFAQAQTPSRLLQLHGQFSVKPTSSFISIIPAPIRANPQGHAPLCRLETAIEKRSPVGMWVQLESGNAFRVQPNWGYVRLRIPLK